MHVTYTNVDKFLFRGGRLRPLPRNKYRIEDKLLTHKRDASLSVSRPYDPAVRCGEEAKNLSACA